MIIKDQRAEGSKGQSVITAGVEYPQVTFL